MSFSFLYQSHLSSWCIAEARNETPSSSCDFPLQRDQNVQNGVLASNSSLSPPNRLAHQSGHSAPLLLTNNIAWHLCHLPSGPTAAENREFCFWSLQNIRKRVGWCVKKRIGEEFIVYRDGEKIKEIDVFLLPSTPICTYGRRVVCVCAFGISMPAPPTWPYWQG